MAAMGRDPGTPVLAARLTNATQSEMRQVLLILLGGAGCIALGLAYALHAFGPTEAQVVLWGWVSIWLGMALAPLTVGIRHSGSRVIKGIAGLGWGFVLLLQLPPILLWFAFHGSGISDGTPPSSFVAHWAYAIPHVGILATSVAIAGDLWTWPVAKQSTRSRLPRAQARE
jgi:hypothetical protein